MEEEQIIVSKDTIQEQALQAIQGRARSGVFCSVGVGKTLIGLKSIKPEDRVLVVYPFISIKESWLDDAKKFNLEHILNQIEFSTYTSLLKHNPANYDYVIFDECHHIDLQYFQFINNVPGIILGLSGTPRTGSNERDKMFQHYFPKVYEYVTDEAIEDEILNDYRITVIGLELSSADTLRKERKDGGFWMTSETKDYLYWCNKLDSTPLGKYRQMVAISRMKAMQGYPTKEIYAKRLLDSVNEKTLVFATSQKQAEKLCPHTYHAKNKDSKVNLELFSSGEIMKLASVNQLSTGVNIIGLKNAVILHSFGNERTFKQKFGRLCRLNPDEVSHTYLLYYKNTVDAFWCKEALKLLNQTKITWK